MAVSFRPTQVIPENLADNVCRWDGATRGHFEVWFICISDPRARNGFWFRYSILSPLEGDPVASLWAAAFDPSSRHENFGIRKDCPAAEAFFRRDNGFEARISDGSLTQSSAKGRIERDGHRIEWNLMFQPCDKTLNHFTPSINFLLRPSAHHCSPNLDARFSGSVVVDDREFILDRAPGTQSHIWGSRQVDEWSWAHCNAFDKRPDTVFEGLLAKPRIASIGAASIQSLYLRHNGEEFHFIRPRLRQQWRSLMGIKVWMFSALDSRVYIEGTAQCRLRDMLQAEYRDPDGEPLYCLNSEIANLKLRIFRRAHGIHYRYVETLKARSTARLEHASRASDPSVKMAFVD